MTYNQNERLNFFFVSVMYIVSVMRIQDNKRKKKNPCAIKHFCVLFARIFFILLYT